jgi:hypothetical protein
MRNLQNSQYSSFFNLQACARGGSPGIESADEGSCLQSDSWDFKQNESLAFRQRRTVVGFILNN